MPKKSTVQGCPCTAALYTDSEWWVFFYKAKKGTVRVPYKLFVHIDVVIISTYVLIWPNQDFNGSLSVYSVQSAHLLCS